MKDVTTDHTKRKTPPQTPGMPVAPITDGTTGAGQFSDALRAYYGGKQFEYGWASLCKMTVPDGLEGKVALDIGCRRGRGVYKLSERVGESGRAIGLDWGPDYIDEAAQWSAHAAVKSGLSCNNMAFCLGYPEQLAACGIEDGSVDMVWINSVINLVFDRQRVLCEAHRVLKPGGLLVCETVTADLPRDEEIIEQAKAIGNSVQAAPTRATFLEELAQAGFEVSDTFGSHEVFADTGFVWDYHVEVVPSNEQCSFTAEVVYAASGTKMAAIDVNRE